MSLYCSSPSRGCLLSSFQEQTIRTTNQGGSGSAQIFHSRVWTNQLETKNKPQVFFLKTRLSYFKMSAFTKWTDIKMVSQYTSTLKRTDRSLRNMKMHGRNMKTLEHQTSNKFNTLHCDVNPTPFCHGCGGLVCVFPFLNFRRCWAGFKEVQGGVCVAPAGTPVIHLPSLLAGLKRSCRRTSLHQIITLP